MYSEILYCDQYKCFSAVSFVVVAVATGFREFGDCAVFTDHDSETCAEVTSSDNPLDFILNADVSQSQNTTNVRVTLRDGDCSDNNQVIIVVCNTAYFVDTWIGTQSSVHKIWNNSYFLSRCRSRVYKK